ncbi:hypothetical protein O6H91_04G134600 [Diphasiastrum complanatum]|uniref:Uncharacterized protein n=1 Tax=Diphasiastrum complanatum TaxID=34168 RepID=A0ACC2E220_DIPCM|nr:hypothetical protein O6H91_04G134600 [Diphasiastrum complanatum]
MATHAIGLVTITFLFVTQLCRGMSGPYYCNAVSHISDQDPLVTTINNVRQCLITTTVADGVLNSCQQAFSDTIVVYGGATCSSTQNCYVVLSQLWEVILNKCGYGHGAYIEAPGFGSMRYELYKFY